MQVPAPSDWKLPPFMYYGLTRSVDLNEWPKAWAARDPTDYPKTKAPEDLPSIVK